MVYRGNACNLVALETADANMRLPLGEIVYGFTGYIMIILSSIGLGPCAPRQRFRSHGPTGLSCSDTVNITICTLDPSVIMYISNMSESAQISSTPL